MASLVCWASGLLEVIMDKDVQPDGGPVVVATGMAGRLRTEMTVHGEFSDDHQNWFVPGALTVDTPEKRLPMVVAFGQRIALGRAKKKGRAYYLRAIAELEAMTTEAP